MYVHRDSNLLVYKKVHSWHCASDRSENSLSGVPLVHGINERILINENSPVGAGQ